MEMQLLPLTNDKRQRSAKDKLCWVKITSGEALALIKSLVSQLQGGPNCGRVESRCEGDASELSIAVIDSPMSGDKQTDAMVGLPIR